LKEAETKNELAPTNHLRVERPMAGRFVSSLASTKGENGFRDRIEDGLLLGAALGLNGGSEASFGDGSCSDGVEDGSSLGVEIGIEEGSKDGCGSGIQDGSPLGVKLGIEKGPKDGC
jgi:hypothetical protein